MTVATATIDRRTAFGKWAALASRDMQEAVLYAAAALTSFPLERGFKLAERAFDSADAPPYALNLERESASGESSFIYVGFDKRHRGRFQVVFGNKRTSPPHQWISAGALVWRNGSALQKYKWWGAKWWQFDKVNVLKTEADTAAALMPQVVDFLERGKVGSHVFVQLARATDRRAPDH